VDFSLGEPQRLLVNLARAFLREHCPPELVQQLALDPRGFSDDLWKRMSALGWPGLLVPGSFGGSEGTLLDVVLLVEEMGRACLPSPFIHSSVVATSLIVDAGSRRQQSAFLPSLALGDRLMTLALTEEAAGFHPDDVALKGEPGGRLSGRKLFVKDAHLADHVIVVARGSGGFNLFVIDSGRSGVTLAPMPNISGDKLFEVDLNEVAVTDDDLLGGAGRGWDALAPALRLGALARAAEMVGCAQRALELSVEYAKVRVQSGRPIGSFQAIQHHCADLLRDVEGARSMVHVAAWNVHEAQSGAETFVAMAKAHAGAACLRVARKAHQILGAISYCEEHPLHLFHKRILTAAQDFGDAGVHLETVAQAIGLV
jgi:alkylation response protein AidB-like acyl-CoA dehydrogenase